MLILGSIVLELFLAGLVFCGNMGRPDLRWLALLPVAYVATVVFQAALLQAAPSAPLSTALSSVYYGLAFACSTWLLGKVFSLAPVGALVLGTLGYCVQHLGSDVSFIFLDGPDAGSDMAATLGFYACHILVMLAVYLVVYRVVGRGFKIDAEIVERRRAWVAACAAAVFFVIVFSMVFVNDREGVVRRVFFVYDALATALIMAVLVLLSRVDALRAGLAANEAIWERRGEQYRLTRESIDLINVKCHDIRKRVAGMGAPALSEASLARIQDSIRVYDASARTGNDALDVVLTAKSLVCSQRGVDLVCMADGAALGFMADDELYFLMENILDNAIEAVLRVADAEKRSVSLSVRREGGFVSIREDNYYEGELSLGQGLPATTKADAANHGFGLRSIRRCVDAHGGEMSLRAEDGVFSLTILLPVPPAA